MISPLPDVVDLLVIGGGINGAGIARDAAGRGLRVLLCEKGDLAQGTSSRSGKYIHGGLRYLEYFEFRLVREALTEREVLLEAAPHIIWPMRIVLPTRPSSGRPGSSGSAYSSMIISESATGFPVATASTSATIRPEHRSGRTLPRLRVFRLLG